MLNISESKKPVVVIVCLVLIVLSVCWMFTRNRPPGGTGGTNKPAEALGDVMAEETAKLLGNRGSVVMIAIAPAAGIPPQSEAIAFEKAVKKAGRVTLAGKEYMDVDRESMELSVEKFLKIASRYPKADAIVSLVGCPLLKESDMAQFGEKPPKLIIVGWSSTGVRAMLQQKIVQVAVLSRLSAPPQKSPKTTREWFDQYFEIFTSANAANLPE
jgi:hypothetical protein